MTRAPFSQGLVVVVTLVTAAAVALGGCREPPPEPSGSCEEGWQDGLLQEAPPPGGNLACFSAGELSSENAPAACQVDVSVTATLLDYQDQDPVAAARLFVLAADDFDAEIEAEGTSGVEGTAELTLPACTPLVYRSEREEALDTWGPHIVIDPTTPVEHNFQSVSEGSKGLLELTFQVEIKPGNGSLVGVVRDCDGEPLEGAQVIVRDAECDVPSSWVPGYFSNQIPDVFRASTSADGVWAGLDVPPGEYVLEAYIAADEEGELLLLGSAPVVVQADAVVIADLQPGRSDGVKIPDACRSCE